MPMNVTSGYSAQFDQFVKFAQAKGVSAKSIARLGSDATLADREIFAADKGGVGGFAALFRRKEDKSANDAARALFKKSVLAMFGNDMSRVPENVKKAMALKDYGAGEGSTSGKPLTARRILAVKAAIDDFVKNEDKITEDFNNAFAQTRAFTGRGYTAAEQKTITTAANLYMKAAADRMPPLTYEAAITEAAQPGTTVNRLMLYGGRFMSDVKSFSEGLALMEKFESWYQDVGAQYRANNPLALPGASVLSVPLKSMTASRLVNGGPDPHPDVRLGFERLVFEELASHKEIDVNADPEHLFGVKYNPAMRFLARGFAESQAATILQVPQEKRAVVYDVFDCLVPFRLGEQNFRFAQPLTGRILRHLDELSALREKGKLTPEAILKLCFPDVESLPSVKDSRNIATTLNDMFTQDLFGSIARNKDIALERRQAMQDLMMTTGCTRDEAFQAVTAGKSVPVPKHAAIYAGTLTGSHLPARAQLEVDLFRATPYVSEEGYPSSANPRYSITFEDGSPRLRKPFVADRTKLASALDRHEFVGQVTQKVVGMCGAGHLRQVTAVLYGLTQSALGELKCGIPSRGVACDEHAAVDFSLSKDPDTGAITIRYSSPEGCPVKFSWTATVDIEGRMTATPLRLK